VTNYHDSCFDVVIEPLTRHSSVKSSLPVVVLLFWQKYPKPFAPNARPSQTSCLLGYSSTCTLASAGRELALEQHGCCECQKCRSIFWPSAQTPRPIPFARCRTSRLATAMDGGSAGNAGAFSRLMARYARTRAPALNYRNLKNHESEKTGNKHKSHRGIS
jgi:hypothetical protein